MIQASFVPPYGVQDNAVRGAGKQRLAFSSSRWMGKNEGAERGYLKLTPFGLVRGGFQSRDGLCNRC
jgi:hypothetical protein